MSIGKPFPRTAGITNLLKIFGNYVETQVRGAVNIHQGRDVDAPWPEPKSDQTSGPTPPQQ